MSRRDKVLAFLAEQPGGSFDGSVADLAADMGDPSAQALSATISVLIREGVVAREPEGVGVVATRLWLVQDGETRDTSRADAPPDPEPEVERCPHGVPAEAAATLCSKCRAAERQRRSRATRRAQPSEPVEEPEAPQVTPHAAELQEAGYPDPACERIHVSGRACSQCWQPDDEEEELAHDGALPSEGPVDPRTIEVPGLDELEARMEPVALLPGRLDGVGPDGRPITEVPEPGVAVIDGVVVEAPVVTVPAEEAGVVLCAPACEQACKDGCELDELPPGDLPPSRVVQEGRPRPARKQRALRADLADQLDMEAERRVVGATLLLDMAVERFLNDLLPFEVATAVRRPDAQG